MSTFNQELQGIREREKKKLPKETFRQLSGRDFMFSSQNTEYPKFLRSEYNSINQLCKTNVIPRLAGSWVKIKLNF